MNSSDNKMQKVLMALRTLCDIQCQPMTLPSQILWPKTRQIANYCDMDIYATRRYLIKLVNKKQAYMSDGRINNTYRWYIIDPMP